MENKNMILALLLIAKGEPLNNSYQLMRILEWKFKVNDSKKVLDQLKTEHLVDFSIVKGIHYYKITHIGLDLIKKEYHGAMKSILQYFPTEEKFIRNLFASFSISS